MLKKLLAKIWKPKCKHQWVPIYEKAIENTYVWNVLIPTETSGFVANSYEYRRNTFTGTAFLKYNYCPICKTCNVSLSFTQGYIPYTADYLLNMVTQHIKQDALKPLTDLIVEKCGDAGYKWNELTGAFDKVGDTNEN